MASGVRCADDIKPMYEAIKKGKKHQYMILEIKDGKICIEKLGSKDSDYETFLEDVMACGPHDCRFGLFDYHYEHKCEGTATSSRNKLLLMLWCPDTAKIKPKMVYASSFDVIKNVCSRGVTYHQATDASEASREEVEDKLRKNDRS